MLQKDFFCRRIIYFILFFILNASVKRIVESVRSPWRLNLYVLERFLEPYQLRDIQGAGREKLWAFHRQCLCLNFSFAEDLLKKKTVEICSHSSDKLRSAWQLILYAKSASQIWLLDVWVMLIVHSYYSLLICHLCTFKVQSILHKKHLLVYNLWRDITESN